MLILHILTPRSLLPVWPQLYGPFPALVGHLLRISKGPADFFLECVAWGASLEAVLTLMLECFILQGLDPGHALLSLS